jgi:hypothetical protein
MNGWSPKDIKQSGTATLSANMSASPVGSSFPLSAGGATKGLVIAINLSGVAGTVTFQLQTGIGSDFSNVTGKTVAGSNGWNYIKLHSGVSGDAALMPLLDVGRLVVTTDGSGAGTINSLYVLQEQ